MNITTCNIFPSLQTIPLGTLLLPQEIGLIHGTLSLEEKQQQHLNNFLKLYQVNNSQENATGINSLQPTETILLSERIFKETYLYSIK